MLDWIQIDRIAFTIPIGDGFPIFWYGILVTVGIALGTWWASREIERRNQDVDELFNGLILVVFVGYIAARLTYVLLDVLDGQGHLYTSFIDVINIRAGGVNILGGFVGAALAGLLYVRWRRLNFWHYADVAGPALLVAQAIGRWGNFINQELYGPPTDLPWGITINAPYRIPPYTDLSQYPVETTRFHPTFLYESIWLFLGFALLVWLNNRYREEWRSGTLFGAFLIWWGGGRAWIEFFRPDQPTIGDTFITYSMITAVLLAITGVLVILARHDRLPLPDWLSGRRRRRRRRRIKPKPRQHQD